MRVRRLPYSVGMRLCLILALAFLAFSQTSSTSEEARLARWKKVEMPFEPSRFTARERQLIDKLVEACRLLDNVYWRQSDLAGLALYNSTKSPVTRSLLMIMGSRWDLLDDNHPFTGSTPMPPGHELYPHDVTAAQIEQYVAKHPEDKAAIYAPYTVVKRKGDRLIGVPFIRSMPRKSSRWRRRCGLRRHSAAMRRLHAS